MIKTFQRGEGGNSKILLTLVKIFSRICVISYGDKTMYVENVLHSSLGVGQKLLTIFR